jgi:hypothetical protein
LKFLLLPNPLLPVFKLPTVQEVPLYSSVAPFSRKDYHQKLKLLFEFLHLLNASCCIKLPAAVQVEPSYSSVASCKKKGGPPAKAKAAV